MTYIGRGSRGGGRAREIRVDGRRFQQRVNKKKVVSIEYGDCVIIASLLGLYDKPAPRRHAAHNHVRAGCVPACPCTWNFLIWSDRPILWPESASQPVRTLVPVLSLQASSDPRRTSSSKSTHRVPASFISPWKIVLQKVSYTWKFPRQACSTFSTPSSPPIPPSSSSLRLYHLLLFSLLRLVLLSLSFYLLG